MMATKQAGKSANAFVKETDDLGNQLVGAYISNWVPKTSAHEYTIQTAVKPLAKNAVNEKVKLIM